MPEEESQREPEAVFSGWSEEEPSLELEHEIGMARRYLQTFGCRNENVWNHLNDIINYVLKEKPPDCFKYFEDMSRELRIKKFFLRTPKYEKVRESPALLEISFTFLKLYRKVECLYENDSPFEDESPADKYLFHNYQLLHDAGIGITQYELYQVYLVMRVLGKTKPVAKLRFWGKILGTERNYLIIEAALTPEEVEKRQHAFTALQEPTETKEKVGVVENKLQSALEPIETTFDIPVEKNPEDETIEPPTLSKLQSYKMPELPLPPKKKDIQVPSEAPGEGVNKFVYFVANDPLDEWTMLPDVTPQQITTSRSIHKNLTGMMEKEVVSFPTFPGNEGTLLRAQIARISASTHVSPRGFYTNGEEEEMVELQEGALYMENHEYIPLTTKELLDKSFQNWVHHEEFILQQGRTKFWIPPISEEEETGEEWGENEREVPPPILQNLGQDVASDPYPSWTARLSSAVKGTDSSVFIRSNIWPGAVAVTRGHDFINFYLGWGTKTCLAGYQPFVLPDIQTEYELGPEIMEMADPTAEMEELRWQMLHPKHIDYEEEMEGEGESPEEDT